MTVKTQLKDDAAPSCPSLRSVKQQLTTTEIYAEFHSCCTDETFFSHTNIITSFLYSTSRGSSSSGRLTAEMLKSPSTILQDESVRLAAEMQSGSTSEFPSLGDISRSSRDSTGELQTPSARPMSMADVIKAQRQKRLMAAQQSSQIQPSTFKTPQRPANRGSFFQQYILYSK